MYTQFRVLEDDSLVYESRIYKENDGSLFKEEIGVCLVKLDSMYNRYEYDRFPKITLQYKENNNWVDIETFI